MIDVTLFTDPACPFAFSSEPVRLRLAWHYGDGLRWHPRMIVLTREEGEAEKLAQGAPSLQRSHGMPIDPAPYPRPSSSEPACRAVVAVRLNAPELEEPFLRRLRVRRMDGGLLDEPELIEGASADVGIEPADLRSWSEAAETASELEADASAARAPAEAALTLGHKLGGPDGARRYTAPSYELHRDGTTAVVPGFNPFEAYDTAIANLEPGIGRRPAPESAAELLAWAPYPLATAEVIAITGLDDAEARIELASVAEPEARGADFYWHPR